MNVSPYVLTDFLDRAPADKIAVVLPEQNISLSYGNLRDQVKAVAGQLAAAGVGRGDRVATSLTNGLPVIVSFLAAGVAGTAAPLNPAYKEEEFKFYLEDTAAKVLLLPPDGADDARRAATKLGVPILTIDMDAAGTVSLSRDGKTLDRKPVTPPSVDDVALVLHTSGSTGRPKRVPLKHANLSISAQNVAAHYALTKDDVSLCVMPLFHVHGLVASTLATFASGGTVVVPAKFSPLSFWRTARDHNVTWYSAVPTLHQLLLARAGDPSDPSRRPAGTEKLRFIRSCSASLPPAVMHALEAAFGAPVLEAYGMTEAAHQMASNPLPPSARKPGSVGQGTDVQISIMDKAGNHLKVGEARRGRDQGAERHHRLRKQSRGERLVVRRRLVPHRRSGDPRRARLPDARRADQGADQPRRRKDLAARDRRGAADPSRRSPRRCASACRTAPGAKRSRPPSCCVKARASARPICSPSARSASPTTSGRSRFTSPQAIPRTATGKIQRGVVAEGVCGQAP